jgi:hypothetical protein
MLADMVNPMCSWFGSSFACFSLLLGFAFD